MSPALAGVFFATVKNTREAQETRTPPKEYTVRPCTPIRMTQKEKERREISRQFQMLGRMQGNRNSHAILGGGSTMVQPLCKTVWPFLIKLNTPT